MTARLVPPEEDPAHPAAGRTITVVVDGERYEGRDGQTLAGVLLAAGIAPRRGGAAGMFCGIGVCFGCTVTVDGVGDVRSCQRRAIDGAVVTTTGAGGDADG